MRRFITRAAMMLLMMLLTATTAWADDLETLTVQVGEQNYTFTTGSDDNGEYYIINDTTAFKALAAYVNGDGDTSGKRFKLTQKIELTHTMIGTSDHPFKGIFDGGGNVLDLYYKFDKKAGNYIAPFRYVEGATIKDLVVSGTIITLTKWAGGVVGRINGDGKTTIIRNCRISVNLYSYYKGQAYHGGLVGSVSANSKVKIYGCAFKGFLATSKKTAEKSTNCSGFIGLAPIANTSIRYCLYRPYEVIFRGNLKYITSGNTFGGNTYKCLYTKRLGLAEGYSCTPIQWRAGITVNLSGTATEYDVSGITSYAGKTGLKCGGALYVLPGDEITLNLEHNDPEDGKLFLGYAIDGTFLSSENTCSYTVPKSDFYVQVDALWADESLFGSGADGTSDHPYTITSTAGLKHLSSLVSSGIEFKGKYFELGADIAFDRNTQNNFLPIGDNGKPFSGTFDGKDHVVSGLNINRTGSNYQALFGYVSDTGSIKNVVVKDATIQGSSYVGAVTGFCSGTISNCYYRNVTFGVEGARNDEGKHPVYPLQTLTPGSNVGISTPPTKTIDGTDYYAAGTLVTLSYNGTISEGQRAYYTVNGTLIDGDQFIVPEEDVTIEAQTGIDFAYYWGVGDGSSDATPYVISNVAGLNLLAMMTRSGENYAGKFFALGNDIDLSGNYFNGIPADFNGTFDGKDHTISGIDINSANQTGFFWNMGGTVKNLNLKGKVTISGGNEVNTTARVGGIALHVASSATIDNCQSLLSITGGLNAEKGGIAGKNEGTVSNCHYLGMCMSAGSAHTIEPIGSGTETANCTNCTPLYLLEGLDSESLGTVTMTDVGSSGTIYGGCYHEAGSTLTLTLTATEKEDYTIAGYEYSDNEGNTITLTDNNDGTYSMTMPAMDVTLMPTYTYNVLAALEQDSEGRYLVKTMDDLRAVAKASLESDLNGCAGMTFLLANDIEDAGDFSGIAVTPAGSGTNYDFYGTFDGGGHTISGLNIVSNAENVGFIGNLSEIYNTLNAGTLKNLTLKNCNVTNVYSAMSRVGMLVGSCSGGVLQNCRVLGGSVHANSDQDPEEEGYIPYNAGAIAGSFTPNPYTQYNPDLESSNNYYDQKVGVFVDGYVQTPGECGTSDPDDELAKAVVITLANNDDNSKDIWTFRGKTDEGEGEGEGSDTPKYLDQTFEVTLDGRTLWKDAEWNTLVLPFSLTAEQIAASPLAGADIRTLADAAFSADDGKLTLTFTPETGEGAVSSIEAGTPYLIKWAAAEANIVNPVFKGVKLDATNRDITIALDATEGQEKSITFSGTYDMMTFDEAAPNYLLLGGANTLYYPDGVSPTTIGAQRAYFQLSGITAGEPTDPSQQVKAFELNFDNEKPTLVSLPSGKEAAGAWFDLNGRKLSSKPNAKGIYLHNGKKVVVK